MDKKPSGTNSQATNGPIWVLVQAKVAAIAMTTLEAPITTLIRMAARITRPLAQRESTQPLQKAIKGGSEPLEEQLLGNGNGRIL